MEIKWCFNELIYVLHKMSKEKGRIWRGIKKQYLKISIIL
jgi:hypothetical protein